MATVFWGFVFKILVKKIGGTDVEYFVQDNTTAQWQVAEKLYNMIPELTSGIMGSHCNLHVDSCTKC